jgi:hypothetical protein
MITRKLMQTLRGDINAALLEVGRKHKVKLTAGNGSFSSEFAHFKLEIMPAGADGTPEGFGERGETFRQYCRLHHLSPGDLGRVISLTFQRQEYDFRITGMMRGGRRVVVERLSDRKAFRYPVPMVREALLKRDREDVADLEDLLQ